MVIINKYNLQNLKAIIYTLKEFTWRTFSQHLGSVVIITFPSISADNRVNCKFPEEGSTSFCIVLQHLMHPVRKPVLNRHFDYFILR